jgi:integrase
MQEELPLHALGAALPPEFDDLRPDIVRFLRTAKERRPSAKTRATYHRAIRRIAKAAKSPEELGARSRRSFQLYRAALVHLALTKLVADCRRVCAGASDVQAIRSRLKQSIHMLNLYPPDGGGSSAWKRPEGGVVRKGKRNGMSRIPEGGLARLVAAFADDPVYADPLRVLFLTGARPCELVNGVEVRITAPGRLYFTIRGGKVTAQTGQPVRVIEVAIDNEVAKALAKRATTDALVVRVTDARALSDKVRGMSMRLFSKIGYVISPYTFRHATAAHLKARGASVASIAKVLGHVSGRSQRGYGTPQQGRRLHSSICGVGAERPVRNTALSQWYEPGAAMPAEEAAPVQPGSNGASVLAEMSELAPPA